MGHSDNKSLSAKLHTLVHCYFKSRDERLAPLETKTLHGVELLRSEVAELVSPVEASIKMYLLLLFNFLVLHALKSTPDPVLGFFVTDMHEFNANFIAVSVFVCLN